MVAFLLLLGFVDSRNTPSLGVRECAVLVTAMFVTLIYLPILHRGFVQGSTFYVRVGYEWFLYVYLWARVLLMGLEFSGIRGRWQVALVFAMAICPDDLFWLQLPQSAQSYLFENSPIDHKSP